MKHSCSECNKEWNCITKDCRVPVEIYCSKCAQKYDRMSIITGHHPYGCHIAIQNGLHPAELTPAIHSQPNVEDEK